MGIIKNQNQGNVNYDHSKASLDAKVKAGNFRELHSDECDKLFEGGKIPSLKGYSVCSLEPESDGEYSYEVPFFTIQLFRYGTDFHGMDCSHAILSGMVGTGVNLIGANFEGSELDEASFRHANLRCANFRGADLTKVDFFGADLRGADFRGACFQDTEILDAFVEGADFRGATFDMAVDNPFYTAPLGLKGGIVNK